MLKGKKIYLRAMEPSDIDTILAWENNPENWLYSLTKKPYSRREIQNLVLNAYDIYTDKQLRFVIALTEDHRAIGAIDLFECDFGNGRAGVGILIDDKADRRKGYAQESLKLILTYCKEVLLLHQVHAEVISNNEGSIRLFERGGFLQTGRKKDWIKQHDGFLDLIILQHIF